MTGLMEKNLNSLTQLKLLEEEKDVFVLHTSESNSKHLLFYSCIVHPWTAREPFITFFTQADLLQL